MARKKAGKRAAGTDDAPQASETALPVVYREMLANAGSSPTLLSEENQPLKRRRIGGRVVTQRTETSSVHDEDQSLTTASKVHDLSLHQRVQFQTVYDDSEDSGESDIDWEEIDLTHNTGGDTSDKDDKTEVAELSLVLDKKHAQSRVATRPKRKPGTTIEKKLRLDIHKLHIICLLAHVHIRNHWCNDAEVHKDLGKILTKRTVSYLNPDEGASQFQKSRSFTDGLGQAMDAFRERFRITARGMSRSYWWEGSEGVSNSSLPNDLDLPMQLSDFRSAAKKLEASRDVGSQLFCAMLRSAGADARLVCSLQPLPLTPATKGALLPHSKPVTSNSNIDSRNNTDTDDSGIGAHSITSAISSSATRSSKVVRSRLTQRVGQEQQVSIEGPSAATSIPARKPKRKRIIESPYPVYWVEAFNDAVQKWIPVDPLVTRSVGKVSKFEPPVSDQENNMSYVIAFEDDGSARDVTRRYAKAYNAKTRRARVESILRGDRWFEQLMRLYRFSQDPDRNQVEDAEFAAREAAEPMPKNIQDFKDHPYYALERHLKQNQVIHPKREMGRVTAGKLGETQPLEPIYRRKDVLAVKSADKWYRLGRVVKPGEQPMKHVLKRRRRDVSLGDDDKQACEDETSTETGLYAFHQTTTYEAPPVVGGMVPRNIYGNLDIYTQSMVPHGGFYVAHPDAARAARAIGIDYADAVTGFEFKGRRGTAVVRGAVVAIEYREAMQETLKAFQHERIETEENLRTVEALRTWKRFLIGLRIRERIEGYEISGTVNEEDDAMRGHEEDGAVETDGGGFLPDHAGYDNVNPTNRQVQRLQPKHHQGDKGGFQEYNNNSEDGYQDESEGGDSLPDSPTGSAERVLERNEWLKQSDFDVGGGGFVTLDEEHSEDVGSIYPADTRTEAIGSSKGADSPLGDAKYEDDKEAMCSIKYASLNSPISRVHISNQPPSVLTTHYPDGTVQNVDDIRTRKDQASTLNEPTQRPEGTAHNLYLEEEELAEARMVQQIHEERNILQDAVLRAIYLNQGQELTYGQTSIHANQHNEATASDCTAPVVQEAGDPMSSTPPPNDNNESDAGQVNRKDSDRGSLLSHDPSDDDADPDWLS